MMKDIYWLPEDSYKKAIGQYRLQLGEILSVFNLHGLGTLIPGAMEEIVEITEDYGKRVRGVDKPIKLKKRSNPRR